MHMLSPRNLGQHPCIPLDQNTSETVDFKNRGRIKVWSIVFLCACFVSWVPSFLARHSAISKRALSHYCERLNTIVSNYSNLMGIIEVTDSMHATVVGSVRVRLL